MSTQHHDELAATHSALDDLGVPATLEGERLPLSDRIEWLNLTRPATRERPTAAPRDAKRESVLSAASAWAHRRNELPFGLHPDIEADELEAAVAALERPAEARPRFVPVAAITALAEIDTPDIPGGELELDRATGLEA